MTGYIDRALHVSGLGWFDTAILQQPGEDELPQSSLNALKALRATERVKYLGIGGDDEVMDTYVSTGAFDVLVTPYHVNVDWRVQSSRACGARTGHGHPRLRLFPREPEHAQEGRDHRQAQEGLLRLRRRRNKNPLAGVPEPSPSCTRRRTGRRGHLSGPCHDQPLDLQRHHQPPTPCG